MKLQLNVDTTSKQDSFSHWYVIVQQTISINQ